MKNKSFLLMSALAALLIDVTAARAVTGGVMNQFSFNSYAHPTLQPAYAACAGKKLREACSFAGTQAPTATATSGITRPEDGFVAPFSTNLAGKKTATGGSTVSGVCSLDPVDEIGGSLGLKCIVPHTVPKNTHENSTGVFNNNPFNTNSTRGQ